MDANWNLYEGDPKDIPEQDKVRLQAYLKGRKDEQREEQLRKLLEEESCQSGDTGAA